MVDVIRYAGFAEETEFAESPAPAAVFHVDIASASLDSPTETQMVFPGGLSRGAVTHRPGAYAPDGDVAIGTDISTIGWFLKWALGGYTFTEGTDPSPNIHEIYATNDNRLPSFCGRIGKDIFEHVFSGCRIDTLTIESEDEFVMATAEVLTSRDSRATIQVIDDLLLPTAYPLAFHELSVTREATGVSCAIRSMRLVIANNLSAAHGQGSRHPCDIVAGEREVTFEATVEFINLDHLQSYWGGENGPAAGGSEELGWGLVLDAGDDGELDIAIPRTTYTAAPVQPSGRDELTSDIAVKAYTTTHTLADAETEVRSELLATIQNAVAEMVPAE